MYVCVCGGGGGGGGKPLFHINDVYLMQSKWWSHK